MGVNYPRLVATAQRLIKANGRPIQLIRFNETPADDDRPWKGPSTEPAGTLDLDGVFVPPNTVREFGLSALGEGTEFIDLITFSQQIIITAQAENDIREYTEVLDRNETWGIIGIQVLRPGPLAVLGFIGVRR